MKSYIFKDMLLGDIYNKIDETINAELEYRIESLGFENLVSRVKRGCTFSKLLCKHHEDSNKREYFVDDDSDEGRLVLISNYSVDFGGKVTLTIE